MRYRAIKTVSLNRGREAILITRIDGLIGFSEAISAVAPKTEVQPVENASILPKWILPENGSKDAVTWEKFIFSREFC